MEENETIDQRFEVNDIIASYYKTILINDLKQDFRSCLSLWIKRENDFDLMEIFDLSSLHWTNNILRKKLVEIYDCFWDKDTVLHFESMPVLMETELEESFSVYIEKYSRIAQLLHSLKSRLEV